MQAVSQLFGLIRTDEILTTSVMDLRRDPMRWKEGLAALNSRKAF
jgi:hypothetical protein